MSDFSFSHSVFRRLVLQTLKNQSLFGKGFKQCHYSISEIDSFLSDCCLKLCCLVKNYTCAKRSCLLIYERQSICGKKGKKALNSIFLFSYFLQCFLTNQKISKTNFNFFRICHLQILSIWTSQELHLIKSLLFIKGKNFGPVQN